MTGLDASYGNLDKQNLAEPVLHQLVRDETYSDKFLLNFTEICMRDLRRPDGKGGGMNGSESKNAYDRRNSGTDVLLICWCWTSPEEYVSFFWKTNYYLIVKLHE